MGNTSMCNQKYYNSHIEDILKHNCICINNCNTADPKLIEIFEANKRLFAQCNIRCVQPPFHNIFWTSTSTFDKYMKRKV